MVGVLARPGRRAVYSERVFIKVVEITAHPERAGRLAEVLGELAAASRSDPGCREFRFARDVEDPLVFRSYEVWDTAEQELAHQEFEHELKALEVGRKEGLAVAARAHSYTAEVMDPDDNGGGLS
jgi:quinol monooxygenase YgiN